MFNINQWVAISLDTHGVMFNINQWVAISLDTHGVMFNINQWVASYLIGYTRRNVKLSTNV